MLAVPPKVAWANSLNTRAILTSLHAGRQRNLHLISCRAKSAIAHPSVQTGPSLLLGGIGQLKCDGTRAETRFRLSAKRTSQFKSAGASVQSTTGSRGVRISSNCW